MKIDFGSCFAFAGGMITPTSDTAQRSIFSDEELIIQLKSGNEKAFSQLYDRYSPALLYSILRMVKNIVNAEEALQLAFKKIVLTISAYSPAKASLFSWMSLIARNEALDFINDQECNRRGLSFPFNENKSTPSRSGASIPVADSAQPTGTPHLQRVKAELYTRGFSSGEIDQVLCLQPCGAKR